MFSTETLSLQVSVQTPNAASRNDTSPDPKPISADSIQYGIISFIEKQYSDWLSIEKTGRGDFIASVSVIISPDSYALQTSLTNQKTGARKSLTASVGHRSTGSILPTLGGDIFYLWSYFHDFKVNTFSDPPHFSLMLNTETLATLTGWNENDLEPTAISASPFGLTVTFFSGFITLSPDFQITDLTVRDITYQKSSPIGITPSAVTVGPTGEMSMLSNDGKSVLRLNLFDGTEEMVKTELSMISDFCGLAGGGFILKHKNILRLFIRESGRTTPREISLPDKRMISAVASDTEGNIFCYDLRERRIKVFTPDGIQVYSINPVIPPSELPFPQVMAISRDGSILLGGSGRLFRLSVSGVPTWVLDSIPGQHKEALPAVFNLATGVSSSEFYILDTLSRRIMKFTDLSVQPVTQIDGGFPSSYDDLDTGQNSSLSLYVHQYLRMDLLLLALQVSDMMNDNSKDILRIRRLIQKKVALAALSFAERLDRLLLFQRAQRAYGDAFSLFKELRAHDPIDPDLPDLVERSALRRKEIRKILLGENQVNVSFLTDSIHPPLIKRYTDATCFTLSLENSSRELITNMELYYCLGVPGSNPLAYEIVSLRGLQKGTFGVPFNFTESSTHLNEDIQAELNIYARYRSQNKVQEFFRSQTVTLSGRSTPLSGQDHCIQDITAYSSMFAWFFSPEDPILQEFTEDTKLAHPTGLPPIQRTASLFLLLKGLFNSSGSAKNDGAPSDKDTPVSNALWNSPRSTLRSLEGSDLNKAILLSSLLGTIGLHTGLLFDKSKYFVLVKTDIPLANCLTGSTYYMTFRNLYYYSRQHIQKPLIVLPIDVASLAMIKTTDFAVEKSDFLLHAVSSAVDYIKNKQMRFFQLTWFSNQEKRAGARAYPSHGLPVVHLNPYLPLENKRIIQEVKKTLFAMSITK